MTASFSADKVTKAERFKLISLYFTRTFYVRSKMYTQNVELPLYTCGVLAAVHLKFLFDIRNGNHLLFLKIFGS